MDWTMIVKLFLRPLLPRRLIGMKFLDSYHRMCHYNTSFSSCQNMIVAVPKCTQFKCTERFLPNFPKRCYSQATTTDMDKKLNPTGAEKKKLMGKTERVEKIFLISENDDITECTLLEAEKISKKRGLQLVKVDDAKGRIHTEKTVYALVTNSQYFGEDWKNRSKKKDADGGESDPKGEKLKHEKSLVIKSKITQHDLLSKIKNLKKLVAKGHTVRIFVEDVSKTGNLESAETVYGTIEENMKDTGNRIIQKRTKGAEIRFQVMPPKTNDAAQSTTSAKGGGES